MDGELLRKGMAWLALALILALSPSITTATTIKVYCMGHAGNPDWYTAGAEEFMKAHPDVKVEIVSSRYGMFDKLLLLVAGGEAPDVITYSGSQLGQMAAKEILLPLDDMVSRDSSFDMKKYFPNVVEAMKYRGTLYAVPRQWSVVGLMYNATLFDERGVNIPEDTWTWDDLAQNAKKLTWSSDGSGTIDTYGFGDQWKNHHRYPIWVLNAGGSFWNEDYTKSFLDSDEAEKGLRFYVDLYNTLKVAPLPSVPGFKSHPDSFNDGTLAMLQTTRFSRPSHEDYTFGVAQVPIGPAGRNTLTITDFVGIYPGTDKLDLAWELAKFYASEEGFQAGMELEPKQAYFWGLSPVRRQAIEQIQNTDDIGDDNWLNLIEVAKPIPTFHPTGIKAVPDLDQVVSGKMSLASLLQETVRVWDQELAESKAKGMSW